MNLTFLYRLGALLFAICALAALGIGSASADTPDTPNVPQVTFHIELIRTTAGDAAKAGVAFDYSPFAPAVIGSIPINPGVAPPSDEGSLAFAHGDGATQLMKYLEAHGKTLSKPTIQTVDGVPATISITEPIKGPYGGGFSGYIPFTNELRTQIDVTPKVQPDGSIQFSLSLGLTGGSKQSGTTMISVETVKTIAQTKSGETLALGGLASTQSYAPAGVPLLTDGLVKDGGFGAADPKTPALFVFVTATVGSASI